ncbi:putative AAA-ATPase [Iris pallida]|uniref:AAA-ATPase n=1 Tax=Iris pallida TaxID=29817 RepID=A0AAX6DT80_IRIPA|nr:putative AAA-ATPase [Iris pallida]
MPISLHHPATFDTLAMDTDLKQEVMGDLARFVERKEYYRKIGRAWKRGYLIHGPPGTGKSSLVAAMANYLKFDIYDLELTAVKWNSALKRLLIGMKNKSILLVEDIDCSIRLRRREPPPSSETSCGRGKDERVTLSGLLNLVDGLWSSCGEERIVVFTTNYKDRLDPALLRPGRMDVHVHMGYCGASAFRTLAYNYHDVDNHPLFGGIEEMIGEAKVTPGEVAEVLARSGDAESAFRGLVEFLQVKRDRGTEEEEEMEDKREEEFDLVSNVSNPENDYNEDGLHGGSTSRTMYSRADWPPINFRGGRGGYMQSFRGRGGHSQSFRGTGEGNLQSYRGRGRGRRGRRQFVNIVWGRVV